MSTLFTKFTTSKSPTSVAEKVAFSKKECNYADNYYGDQVCIDVKVERPRINLHLGVQI